MVWIWFQVMTKPHGHGDIHSLLYKEGITKIWRDDFGIDYLVMFQVSELFLDFQTYLEQQHLTSTDKFCPPDYRIQMRLPFMPYH